MARLAFKPPLKISGMLGKSGKDTRNLLATRIFMSATSYPREEADWQGVFIRHIAAALVNSSGTKLNLWAPDGPRHPDIHYACTPADRAWLARLADRGGIAHLLKRNKFHALIASGTLLVRLRAAYRRAASHTDVFHVNWLQNALALSGLDNPALVSVLGTDFKLLQLPGMKSALRHALRQRPAVLAPNAEWMCSSLERQFGDLCRVTAVPFGIDDRWYQIRREPESPARWLAVVRITREKIGSLFDWGEALFKGAGRELHLIGPNQDELTIPDWIHFHGSASPAQLAEKWFPGATGLITLSRHSEGRPQVMLEAMAAGLPIIASALPAHRDFIEDGHTGRLVRDAGELADALDWLEDPANQDRLSGNCRQFAYDSYGTWRDCAARYQALYQTIIT